MDLASIGWNGSLTRKKEQAGVKGCEEEESDVNGRKVTDGLNLRKKVEYVSTLLWKASGTH